MIGAKSQIKQKKSINVCVLIDAWEPIWGGGQTHVWELATAMVRQHDIGLDIFTRALCDDQGKRQYTKNESYIKNKLRIFRVGPVSRFFHLPYRLAWLITVMRVVLLQHRQSKYSLIHAHAYLSAIPGKMLSILLGIPIIFTVHGSNNMDRGTGFSAIFERFLLTQIPFTAEISVSRYFLKYKNVNKSIKIIPNGVDVRPFDRIANKQSKKDTFTFLWVGRFDRVKAVPVLIEAFAQLTTSYSHVKLELVGYGYDEAKIRALVIEKKLKDQIIFLGKKTRTELIAIYKKANVFVLPSYSEGQSLTLLEAFAAKLPIIASDVGDHNQLVKPNHNGFLVKPGDVMGLEKIMRKVINHPSLSTLGINGYKEVQKNYNWDDAVTKTYELYLKCIKRS